MIQIDIRPLWRIRSGEEREFEFQLVELLAELDNTAKLTLAAERAGISYRHAWNMIEDWELFFGAKLVVKARGRGTTLTVLGKRLLLAGRRAQARLAPELANLASEFARSLNATLTESPTGLALQASHDFAVAMLQEGCAARGIPLDVQYRGSFDALAALRRRECDLAGFHVPIGPLGVLMARRYAECLPLDRYRLVSFVTRTQGMIVRAGNPKSITGVADLVREDVRMVNRQRGSGTRALLEFMISAEGLDRARIQGYDTDEITHSAVAAMISGHQADVGLGVQPAATQYHLGFVPLCLERYYLACHVELMESAAMKALIVELGGPQLRERVASLPGYSAPDAGSILDVGPAADSLPTPHGR